MLTMLGRLQTNFLYESYVLLRDLVSLLSVLLDMEVGFNFLLTLLDKHIDL